MNFMSVATLMFLASVTLVSAGNKRITKPVNCIERAVRFLADGIDVDLMHLIDGSGSVTLNGFSAGIQATRDVTDMVQAISADGIIGAHPTSGSRLGYIQFSHPWVTSVRISLPVSASAFAFKQALNLFPYTDGSSTATATGLALAGVEFASYSQNRNKRIWMATDGKSNVGGDPVLAAKWLKDWGAKICVIAIGPNTKNSEINGIASVMPGGKKRKCVCRINNYQVYKEASARALATILAGKTSK